MTPAHVTEDEVVGSPVPVPQRLGFSGSSFGASVSGEWFGYEVTFSGRTGAVQEVPERFVPEEYRTWNVSVTGFDTLTSTMISTCGTTLHTRLTRALPTVGCEADAIAGDVTDTSSTNGGGFEDGSYTIGPMTFDVQDLSMKFAFCVAHPEAKGRRARVDFGRVDQKTSVVRAVLETWDAPYCGGAILPGCGGPDTSFANEPRADPHAAAGDWHVSTQRCTAEGDWVYEDVVRDVVVGRKKDESKGLLALPRGLSVKVDTEAAGGEVVVEAAWLVDRSRAVVRRVYDKMSCKLVRTEHVLERRGD